MKRRGLLLDRDGVINEDHGYVGSFEQFDFRPEIFPFLRYAQDKAYKIAIVTNQSGVARGYYTRESYEDLTTRMSDFFAGEGVHIDLVLACFTHPEGINETLARDSYWRKPNPGMILEAALRLDLDLAQSIMIGDKDCDVRAAKAAGIPRLYLVGERPSDTEGVRRVRALKEISL